jgi:hypothetical protein
MIYNTDGLFRKDSNTVISMLQNVEGIDEDQYGRTGQSMT